LKIEFGTTETNPLTTMDTVPVRKHGWLPILIVLFLISYGLMTMLIVEQGRTIESQRALIHELFRDSTELSAVRMKAQQDEHAQSAQSRSAAKNPSSQNQSVTAPSTQVPALKAPSRQTPSSQAVPQNRAQNQKSKSRIQMPTRPASDINDSGRSLITL
jgi:hypothetical protein